MINRKFSEPLGRATKFSHPRATMSVMAAIFIVPNKFTAFCAIRLLDFRPTDHRRPTKHRRRADARCFDHEGCRRHARGRWGSRCARQRLVSLTSKQDFASSGAAAPIENSPPGTQTIPSGASRGGVLLFGIVGANVDDSGVSA